MKKSISYFLFAFSLYVTTINLNFCYLLILGSCKALSIGYHGCCLTTRVQSCFSIDCHCDQHCHSNNDCCNDIADIGCHPVSSSTFTVSPAPTDTLGKTKSEVPHFTFTIMCAKVMLYLTMYILTNSYNKIIIND